MVAVLTCNSWAVLRHSYTFENGNANDSTGTAHGTLQGIDAVNNGAALVQGGSLLLGAASGGGAALQHYADLPAASLNLSSYSQLTLEMWSTGSPNNAGFSWGFGYGRFGMSPDDDAANNPGDNPAFGQEYLMMNNVVGGGNDSRGAITSDYFNYEVGVNNGAGFVDSKLHHWVVTIDSSGGPDTTVVRSYFDGVLTGTDTADVDDPSDLSEIADINAFLGRSLYTGDAYYIGTIAEFNIYDNALSAGDVANNNAAGPVGNAGPTMTIDRVSGTMFLSNLNDDMQVSALRIHSDAGALDVTNWIPITGNYDGGNGFDTDFWSTEAVNDSFDWGEFDLFGGDGGVLGAGGLSSMQLGDNGAYIHSAYEDVEVTLEIFNSATGLYLEIPASVEYVNGIDVEFGDLDLDGDIDGQDWLGFVGGHLTDLSGMTPAQSYTSGDLDGDGDNDFADFRLFEGYFDAANGTGALAALIAGVPEPSTGLLLALAGGPLALMRRKRS